MADVYCLCKEGKCETEGIQWWNTNKTSLDRTSPDGECGPYTTSDMAGPFYEVWGGVYFQNVKKNFFFWFLKFEPLLLFFAFLKCESLSSKNTVQENSPRRYVLAPDSQLHDPEQAVILKGKVGFDIL